MDLRLLRRLQADPDMTCSELSEKFGISPATCWRRIEGMKRNGTISGFEGCIDWKALGYEIEVSLRIKLDKAHPKVFEEFIRAARKVPEVTEIQTFLGRVDVRLTLLAKNSGHYRELYRDRILALPNVSDIEPLMLISTVKDSKCLPI
ncbi:MAG: Lrp/AsnC family transcriptional regulator [Albidovulum sp.]|nr:Lrp/AsnC family transcriptional regulator [Albidovulum sp.]